MTCQTETTFGRLKKHSGVGSVGGGRQGRESAFSTCKTSTTFKRVFKTFRHFWQTCEDTCGPSSIARPVHLIITMIKWFRTSRLSIKNSLSWRPARTRAGLRALRGAEMCSGSEAGSYVRLVDFVYHSKLGLSVIKKKKKTCEDTCGPSSIAQLQVGHVIVYRCARARIRGNPQRLKAKVEPLST